MGSHYKLNPRTGSHYKLNPTTGSHCKLNPKTGSHYKLNHTTGYHTGSHCKLNPRTGSHCTWGTWGDIYKHLLLSPADGHPWQFLHGWILVILQVEPQDDFQIPTASWTPTDQFIENLRRCWIILYRVFYIGYYRSFNVFVRCILVTTTVCLWIPKLSFVFFDTCVYIIILDTTTIINSLYNTALDFPLQAHSCITFNTYIVTYLL